MLFFARYVLLITILGGIPFLLNATHNRAGEITYKWLYGYTYSVTLTMYTDDGPSVADRCKMTIYFGDGDSCVAYRENGSSSPPTAECVGASSMGVIICNNPTVKKNIYSCVHTYSGTGNFMIYTIDRNRNSGIINIPNSVNQPFYVESLLVIGVSGNNSSLPSFDPIDQAGFAKCFYHNRGAYDPDGDSLSYELTSCRGEDPVSGNIGAPIPGYVYPDPGPSGTFTNAVTGTITWCVPQMNGEYSIAFVTKEWRKQSCGSYSLVGTVLRDMQIIVNNTSNSVPVISVATNTCLQAGSTYSTSVSAIDPNNNSIELTGGFPVTSIGTVSAVNPTGTFSWNTSCAHVREAPYTIYYKAIDNGLPSFVNFATQNISVIAPAPMNLSATSGTNVVQLKWNKPLCHPTSGNKISHYMIHRSTTATTWVHSACETGVPAYSGLSSLTLTPTENDTVFDDYSVASLPNGSNCYYSVYAVYTDCAESYASNVVTSQVVIGVKELNAAVADITVYPNPSSENNVNVSIVPAKACFFYLELFDLNGRKIKTLNPTFVDTSNTKIVIDLAGLEKGYYLLKVEDEKRNSIHKPLIKIN